MYQRILFWGTLSLPSILGTYTYLRFLESHHPKYLEQGLYFVFVALVWFTLGGWWAYQQRNNWTPLKLQLVAGILMLNVASLVCISPFVNRTLNTEYVTIVNESVYSIDSIWVQTSNEKKVLAALPGLESVRVQLNPKDINNTNLNVHLFRDDHTDQLFVHQRSLGFRQSSILAISQNLEWVNHHKRVIDDQMDARQTKIRYQQWNKETYLPATNLNQYRQQQSYYPVQTGLMAYLDIGPPKAPPILLLHDGLSNGFLFRKVAQSLAEEGFRVIVPDLLGAGGSDPCKELDHIAPANQARNLEELMKGLFIKQWTQVVYGQADFILYEQLEQYSERLERLILLESTYSSDLRLQEINPRPAQSLLSKVMIGLEFESWIGDLMMNKFWRKKWGREIPSQVLHAYQSPLQEKHVNTAWYWHTNIENHLANWPRYHQISKSHPKPALLLRSTLPADNGWTAEQQTNALIQHLGWSQPRVDYLDNCGNLSPEVCPDELAHIMLSYLRETS